MHIIETCKVYNKTFSCKSHGPNTSVINQNHIILNKKSESPTICGCTPTWGVHLKYPSIQMRCLVSHLNISVLVVNSPNGSIWGVHLQTVWGILVKSQIANLMQALQYHLSNVCTSVFDNRYFLQNMHATH